MIIRLIDAVGSALIGSLLATVSVNTGTAQSAGNPTRAASPPGSALDFLVAVSTDRHTAFAVDPEILSSLAAVDFGETPTAGNAGSTAPFERLTGHLQQRGYVIVPVRLTPSQTVHLVTTRDHAIYCAAAGQLKRGNTSAAVDALGVGGFGSSEFGQHCRAMAETFEQTQNSMRVIARRDISFRAEMQRWKTAQAGVWTGRAAAGSALRGATSGRLFGGNAAITFVESSASHASDAERNLQTALRSMLDEVAVCNLAIGQRFQRAYEVGLFSEARYWFGIAVANLDRYRVAVRLCRQSGLRVDVPSPERLRDTIAATRVHLQTIVGDADARVERAMASLVAGNERDASMDYTRAFLQDRANPLARIGTGYCLFQDYVRTPELRMEFPGFTPVEPPKEASGPMVEPGFDIRDAAKVFQFGVNGQHLAQAR